LLSGLTGIRFLVGRTYRNANHIQIVGRMIDLRWNACGAKSSVIVEG